MAIANRTTAEVYALTRVLGNAQLAVLRYRSESRNPARTAEVDAALTAAKTALDATVADAIPNAG